MLTAAGWSAAGFSLGASAVFHATGVRVRNLPARIEKLLDAPAMRMRT